MNQLRQPASLSGGDVLYEVARVACLAPSIANSQPWRWRIHGDTLELFADRSRQLTLDHPQGRLLTVSCGAALHHATIVLAVLGVTATLERIDDPTDPDLLARLSLTGTHPVTAEAMRLHHALRTRCSDQRPFLGVRSLPDEVLDLVRHSTEPFGVTTHAFDPPRTGLLALGARSAATFEQRKAGYQDGTGRSTRDGDAARAMLDVSAPQGDLYTTYLALATANDTRTDWLHTGEAVSAALLTATTFGLATSVMSDVVEDPAVWASLRAAVAPDRYPQLVVRLGVNESAPAVQPTARRPYGEVIQVVPGIGGAGDALRGV